MITILESLRWVTDAGWLPWLLDMWLKAAVLLLAAFGITKALGRASASVRHHVWTLAFVSALALPILASAAPSWHVTVPGWPAGATERARVTAVDPVSTGRVGPVPAAETGMVAPASGPAAGRIGDDTGPAGSRPEAVHAPALTDVGHAIFWIWILGVLLLLGRVGTGIVAAWRTARAATPVRDPAWSALVRKLCGELGVAGPVTVLRSERVRTPMAWGLIRPVLLLPEDASRWSPERRRAVLLHELAHVRRRDCLVQLVAEAARALHWPNPLAWIGARKLRSERERACDDFVLDAGTRSADYARLLLDVARSRGDRRLARATVSMARSTELEGRLLAVLDRSRDRRRPGPVAWIGSIAIAAGLAASLAIVQPVPAPLAARSPVPVPAAAAPAPASPRQIMDVDRPQQSSIGAAVDQERVAPTTARQAPPAARRPGRNAASAWVPRVVESASAPSDTLEERVLEAFVRALSSERAGMREEAAHALGVSESARAVGPLSLVLREDPEGDVREQAAWALGMIESAEGVAPLLAALEDSVPGVREQAAWALGMIESGEAVEGLMRALRADDVAAVREQAAWALGMIEDERATEALIDALEDDVDAVAEQAMWALGQLIG